MLSTLSSLAFDRDGGCTKHTQVLSFSVLNYVAEDEPKHSRNWNSDLLPQ